MPTQLETLVPFITNYLGQLIEYQEKDVVQQQAELMEKMLSYGPDEKCDVETERLKLLKLMEKLESTQAFRDNLNEHYGSQERVRAATEHMDSPIKEESLF